jgi:hypothetical protein
MTEVRFPAKQEFSLRHKVQIASGAHPASYPFVTNVLFSGIMLVGVNLTNLSV